MDGHTCQTGFFEAEDFGDFFVEPALDLGPGDIRLIYLPFDGIAVNSDVSVVQKSEKRRTCRLHLLSWEAHR